MAKRGGSELNHDNWDREDEKEEAGNFQAATADEMKGRIIKRARRRNIGEGGAVEKKNAFASFGGFGGKPDVQAPSFSFGQKSSSESSDKPSGFSGSFGFGLPQSTEQKSLFGSPAAASFGSSIEAQKPKTPSFGTEAFSFGSKTPTTGGSGGGGSGGSGGGAFSLSTGTTSGFSFGSSAERKETVFGGSIKPLPPVSASPASNTEKEASPLRSDSLAGSAAQQTASFKFGGTTTPTASVPAAAPADTGASSLFAFGTAKTTSDPAAGGFLFGSKTSTTSQEPPSFGLSTSSPSSAFAFGETKTNAEKTQEKDKKDLSGSSGFVFGKSSSPVRTPPFSYNSEANKGESSKAVSVSSNSGDKASGSRSPAIISKPTSKHSTQYLSHLKALNKQVLAWLKMHIESNPLVILSPVFKDYETHLEEINTKYGAGSSSVEALDPAPQEKTIAVSKESEQPTKAPSEPAKPFSFGSFSTAPTTSNTAAASPFSFGSSSSPAAAKVENPTSSSSAAFSFSANSTTAPAPSFGAFSFGSGAGGSASAIAPVAPIAAATEDAGDDEDQPPVVEIKQVEENDALYSKKCKLFYKKDNGYKEKGLGMLHLKSVDGDKTQLLVRADTNLGNVLLNILLSSQMPTTRVGKNNVMIVCVPNPPIDPKEESSEPCPMLLR